MVFGAPTSTGKGMRIMVDSSSADDSADWVWCPPKGINNPEMIQGIQFPGDVLVSQIEVLSTAITRKAVQSSYYKQRSRFAMRKGPSIGDNQRMTDRITYNRRTFSYPMTLVAPPIVLQTRVTKTKDCSRSSLGSEFQNYLWNGTVNGVVCAPPYECDEDLINASTSMLACSNAETPDLFFGRTPEMLDGKPQFTEFLQSVTEAPLLVRNGVVYPTASYLDAQTRQVVVQMVAFAPDYGVASTIRIIGDFGTQIQVSFVIQHFQALEGLLFRQYTMITVLGITLAVFILVDKLITVAYMDFESEKSLFFIDLFLQVVLLIVYFSIRYIQITQSGKELTKIIGTNGLSGVPWADTGVELNVKMERFFNGLDMFAKKIATEKIMSYVYFFHATCALMRLIFQTSAHPRTAILVKTLRTGVDDLWHFLLLLAVLFCGFLALALAQFSGSNTNFSTFQLAFEVLYDMMMDGLPYNWMSDPVVAVYVIFFNVLVFLTMLNFIIAIVVESYTKVCQENEKLQADQEFFTDVADIVTISCHPAFFGWPSHLKLIEGLQNSRKISLTYMDLRNLSPRWKMKSIKAFMNYYEHASKKNGGYMTGQPDLDQYLHRDLAEMTGTIDEVERRISALFNRLCPTMAQRIQKFSYLNGMQKITVCDQIHPVGGNGFLGNGFL